MRTINLIIIGVLTSFLYSCSSWYYCTVSGYGVTPQEKSYYIAIEDPTLDNELEFLEYVNILKQRLNEKGYVETDSKNADLCVYLSYYVGEEKLASTNTISSSGSYINTKSHTNSNTSAYANGNASTNIYGNTAKTTGSVYGNSTTNTKNNTNTYVNTYNSSNSTNIYETPIGCKIVVKDAKTQKIIWQVDVSDKIASNQNVSFRRLMPWMLTSAQQYFGVSGEGQVKITEKEGKEKGLVFPYN